MIERVSPITRAMDTVGAGSAFPPRLSADPIVPVILLATAAEKRGAEMRVGGLRVIDRTVRQIARLRDATVIILSDGSIRLPRRLPSHVTVRATENPGATLAALKSELVNPIVVGADISRVQGNRLDRGARVVDRASRRLAEDAVFADLLRPDLGVIDRSLNRRVSLLLTRYLLVHLPLTPGLVTLVAGLMGLWGAFLVGGAPTGILTGFLLIQGQAVLSGCGEELARLRFRRSAASEWFETIVNDVVGVALVLAVGVALWRRGGTPVGDFKDLKVGNALVALSGGTFLDMKIALAAAGMMIFSCVFTYRELLRQGEGGDVMRIRWWFSYGQSLRSMTGAGSGPLRALLMMGRRDFFILASLGLAFADLLPIVVLYALVVGIVRAGAAIGQVMTPEWRLRPPV